MSTPHACPDSLLLQKFLDAVALSETDVPWTRDLLEQHVNECASCQRSLERLVAGPESWEGAARLLAGLDANRIAGDAETPALRNLIDHEKDQNLEGIPGGAATAGDLHLADLSLDFLQPSDQPDSRGRLGAYEVLEVVGRGGMGVVLKAYDPSLRRIVAIKVMAVHLASSPVARKRFVREARAAAAVSHDHVVAIFAVEEHQEPPFIVMQFISGKTLQERLALSGPLAVSEVLRIGMQTASGLAAAHAQGLVHRDIKPANILLENGVERVKITDFGLARAVDDVDMTQSGIVAGTPQFMAPEQANGEAIDLRSDLFSLGSVLYMLCTGRPPFRATTTMGLLKRICEEAPRPIRELNPEVPEWLEAIITKLLAKRPDGRFQSAKEVAELLGNWLAHVQRPLNIARPSPLPLSPVVSNANAEPGVIQQSVSIAAVPPGRTWQEWRMQYDKQLREAYPTRIYWITAAIWGMTWGMVLADTNLAAVVFMHYVALAALGIGLGWPVAVIGYAWLQKWRSGNWETTVLRGTPRRLLLQPMALLFLGASGYWAWQQATCGTISFNINDRDLTVTLMGPSLKSNQNYSADFYPLRVRAGTYQWSVRHNREDIAYGKVDLVPGQNYVIQVNSPYPVGEADASCLPGRWQFQSNLSSTQITSSPFDSEAPGYIDIKLLKHALASDSEPTNSVADTPQFELQVHWAGISDRLSQLSGASPREKPTANASQSQTYSIRVSSPPEHDRGPKWVDLLQRDPTSHLQTVVAHGVFSADQKQLGLCLGPVDLPRPSWAADMGKKFLYLPFERASDRTLLQGKWGVDSEVARPVTLTFFGDNFEDRHRDPTSGAIDAGIFKLDPSSQPKRITLHRKPVDGMIHVSEGIYRFEGEQLILCLDDHGGIPRDFEPHPELKLRHLKLNRVKD
jgi:uncharacterized protein (TIGR03067 family)